MLLIGCSLLQVIGKYWTQMADSDGTDGEIIGMEGARPRELFITQLVNITYN